MRFAIALWLVCALIAPQVAFADETREENAVNPHQLPDSSFIYDTSIADLAGADSYYDGQTVQVVGEAVGDNIRATADGSYRWIALVSEDGTDASVSVYMTDLSAGLIDEFGRYGATGTVLQVQGTYNLACTEHDGLSDLHAASVSVVRKGVVHEEEFDARRFLPGLGFVALGVLLTLAFYFLRERQR